MAAKLVDPKCYQLAKHFYRHAPEDVLMSMAGAFQDIAESFTDHRLTSGETLQDHEDRMMFEPKEG